MKTTRTTKIVTLLTAFIIIVSVLLAFGRDTALASFVQNAWQGYKLTSGLVGYWSFDGSNMDVSSSTREVLDGSGSGYHGDWRNHSTTTVIGKIGQAIDVDGSNDFVTMGDINVMDGVTRMTVSAWVRTSKTSEAHAVDKSTCDGNVDAGTFELGANFVTPNKASFTAYKSGGSPSYYVAESATSITDDKWHHAVGVYDGNDLRIYIDGKDDGSTSAPGITLPSNSTSFEVGGNCNGNANPYEWDGGIDEVRVYSRALSSDEVKRLYLIGASLKTNVSHRDELTSDLIGNWTFDGKDMGPNVRDVSGQGNHGALQNQNPTTTTVGKIGQGLSFDGTDDYVDAGDIGALDVATELTACAWVNHLSITSDDAFIAKDSGGGSGFTLFRDDVGINSSRPDVYSFAVFDSADNDEARIETPSNTTPLSTWTQVCGTFLANNASGLRLYVNGTGVSDNPVSTAGISAISGGLDVLAIGARSDGSMPFDGKLDEVRIYSRALPAEEIKRLYLMGASLKTNVAHRDELTAGLAGYWTFDGKDMVQNVVDVSGQGHSGGIQNQTSTTTVIGKVGQGLQFDGSDDHVIYPNTITFNSADFTVSGWIKMRGAGGGSGTQNFIYSQRITGVGDANPAVGLYVNTSYQPAIEIRDNVGAVVTVTSPTAISLNEWHHVLGVKTGANLTLYVDGVQAQTAGHSLNGDFDAGVDVRRLGSTTYGGGDAFLNGVLDEVRVYTRALSPDEIKRLYLMGK